MLLGILENFSKFLIFFLHFTEIFVFVSRCEYLDDHVIELFCYEQTQASAGSCG